jgi:hypothetical protein
MAAEIGFALRRAARAIWNTGDLVLIVLLMYAAGGVLSSALLSRDFLVGTELKNASSSAAVDSLDREALALDDASTGWAAVQRDQENKLQMAIARRPEAAIELADANRNAAMFVESLGGATQASDRPAKSATEILFTYCQTHSCSAEGIAAALDQARKAENASGRLDAEIAARTKALDDINAAVKALQASPFYPDGQWLVKREIRYALDQWRSYKSNVLLKPFVIFASAPIFILNLSLASVIGATGASIAYLLARVAARHPDERPNFIVSLLLGGLASATIFLVYSAGLGFISASSQASLTFPDPLFVTGVSLITGFNADAILKALGTLAGRILPSGGAPVKPTQADPAKQPAE